MSKVQRSHLYAAIDILNGKEGLGCSPLFVEVPCINNIKRKKRHKINALHPQTALDVIQSKYKTDANCFSDRLYNVIIHFP